MLAAVGLAPGRPRRGCGSTLSPRLWLVSFLATSLLYLVQTDSESAATGRWPLLAPWLHSSALPVFAVLAVLVALAWSAVASWLSDYERYAKDTCARAERIGTASPPPPHSQRTETSSVPPRERFGLAFECRPPPLPA